MGADDRLTATMLDVLEQRSAKQEKANKKGR